MSEAGPAGLVLRAERPGEEAAVRDVVPRAFLGEHGDLVDQLRASDAWLGLSFVAERGRCGRRSSLAHPEPVLFVEGDPAYYSPLGCVAGAAWGSVGRPCGCPRRLSR